MTPSAPNAQPILGEVDFSATFNHFLYKFEFVLKVLGKKTTCARKQKILAEQINTASAPDQLQIKGGILFSFNPFEQQWLA